MCYLQKFFTEQICEIEREITKIVGKNESGKTALLEAMAKSNYFEVNTEFKFDKDLDYPRGELTKVRNENPAVLTCEYEISDTIIQEVENDFAEGLIVKQNVSVTSYYDNSKSTAGIMVDFDVFKKWLITSFNTEENGKNLSAQQIRI